MNASAERVWSILADDFENVAHWASTIPASGPNPLAVTVPEGAASAMPGFVTGAQNACAVSELGAGRTQVSSTASARVTGLLGALAAPMLRIRFGRTVRPALDDPAPLRRDRTGLRAQGAPDEHGIPAGGMTAASGHMPASPTSPLSPDAVRRSWTRVGQAVGGPVRSHDLSHTCLILLLEQRTLPHVVQQIAGHAARCTPP